MYPPDHFLGAQRNGLNHTGMEQPFALLPNSHPPLRDYKRGPVKGDKYPDPARYLSTLAAWYRLKNVKCVRLLFSWEAVQPPPVPGLANAPYNTYWADLLTVINGLLGRGIYVLLCPWGYNSASNDTDILYHDQPVDPAPFGSFWGTFATKVNTVVGSNHPRVAFDLINEPHVKGGNPGDVGITTARWFSCAEAAITQIRMAGATNTIFVPGMNWAGAKPFVDTSGPAWLTMLTEIPTNANIAVTAHCYSGVAKEPGEPQVDKPTDVLRDACDRLVKWARPRGLKVNIGEIAIDAGVTIGGVPCSTLGLAQAQWGDWHRFCRENNDVIVGWNWWANSAGAGVWGWGLGGSCSNDRQWALTTDRGVTQTVYMDLIESSLPVPPVTLEPHELGPQDFVHWRSATTAGAAGSLHGREVTLTGPMGTAFYFDDHYPGFASGLFTPRLRATGMVEIVGRPGHSFTLDFGGVVKDPIVHLGSLASVLTFTFDAAVDRLSGDAGFRVDGRAVKGSVATPEVGPDGTLGPSDANGSVRLLGALRSITFTLIPNFGDGSIADGVFMQVGGTKPSGEDAPPAVELRDGDRSMNYLTRS